MPPSKVGRLSEKWWVQFSTSAKMIYRDLNPQIYDIDSAAIVVRPCLYRLSAWSGRLLQFITGLDNDDSDYNAKARV